MPSYRTLLCQACLLLFAAPLTAAERWDNPLPYPPLPEAISSFGAAVSGDHLYVFGGHVGRIAGNSLDALSPHFVRLNLSKPDSKWEPLAMHHSSQSPGLVTWRDQIYRVGGLSFKNRADADTQFHSLSNFARYDPQTNRWTDLPALPEPRSSLDAAVVDDRLYVVGGWNLQDNDSQGAPWHEEALVFDLTKPDGAWTPIAKPPFIKRAIALAAHHHKLYVLGGMSSTNQFSNDVHIYDPATNRWSEGPKLPGKDALAGFAISAFAAGNKLYFNGSEGVVYGLNDTNNTWEAVERLLFARSFHRLLPVSDSKLVAVAGVARGGGYLSNVELINLAQAKAATPKLAQWSLEFPGKAKHSQILLLQNSLLYAFGGNGSRSPHDFSQESILNEAFRFDLAARSVEKLPSLPQATQSGSVHIAGGRIDQSIYVLGGITFEGDKYQSTASMQRYRLRSKSWTDESLKMPASRAMFVAAAQGDVAWMFGGSEVNTDAKGLATATWSWSGQPDDAVTVVGGAEIPTARRSFGGAAANGQFFAIGGLGADGKLVEKAEAFNFETRKWREIASPQVARVFPQLALSGGKLYLAGGFTRVDGHFAPAKSVEVYDIGSNHWSVAYPELPFGDRQVSMLAYQDRLLFFGIDSKQDGLAHFALLDPQPQTVGFGVEPARTEENTDDAELTGLIKRLDKNQDGELAAEEVGERFRPIVAKIDTDKNGVASKAEIAEFLRQEKETRGSAGTGGRPR